MGDGVLFKARGFEQKPLGERYGDFGIHRVAGFAPCPPAFGLLLDLRKTHYPMDTARLGLCRPGKTVDIGMPATTSKGSGIGHWVAVLRR